MIAGPVKCLETQTSLEGMSSDFHQSNRRFYRLRAEQFLIEEPGDGQTFVCVSTWGRSLVRLVKSNMCSK